MPLLFALIVLTPTPHANAETIVKADPPDGRGCAPLVRYSDRPRRWKILIPAGNPKWLTQRTTAGVSWKTYQEDISGLTCPLASVNKHSPKHNPFVYFDDVTNTGATSLTFVPFGRKFRPPV